MILFFSQAIKDPVAEISAVLLIHPVTLMTEVPPLQTLTREVVQLTREVSHFLLEENKAFRRSHVEYKGLNSLVSYVDKEAENRLVSGCRAILPQAGFLTEEGTTGASADGSKGLVWIIDPLDGTTNFVHRLPVFSISVALALDGKPIAGVVAHVPNQEFYRAWKGGGAWCNDEPIRVSPQKELSKSLLATGFPYFEFDAIQSYLAIIHELMKSCHGLRRMGSAAIDLAYVARGIFDGFFEYNLAPWDVAAGICLVEEAGGKVSDFSGAPNALFGRQILAAGPVHDQVQAVIRSHGL